MDMSCLHKLSPLNMCTACDGYVTGIQVPPRSGDWKGVKLLEKNDDDDHQILW